MLMLTPFTEDVYENPILVIGLLEYYKSYWYKKKIKKKHVSFDILCGLYAAIIVVLSAHNLAEYKIIR